MRLIRDELDSLPLTYLRHRESPCLGIRIVFVTTRSLDDSGYIFACIFDDTSISIEEQMVPWILPLDEFYIYHPRLYRSIEHEELIAYSLILYSYNVKYVYPTIPDSLRSELRHDVRMCDAICVTYFLYREDDIFYYRFIVYTFSSFSRNRHPSTDVDSIKRRSFPMIFVQFVDITVELCEISEVLLRSLIYFDS